jgi:hypothetical protein
MRKQFFRKTEKGGGLLEGLVIGGNIILKCILNKVEGAYWINMVQNGG